MGLNNTRPKKPFIGRTANVILTYQNGEPIFEQNARFEHTVILGFGYNMLADEYYPVVQFFIDLIKEGSRWLVKSNTRYPWGSEDIITPNNTVSHYMQQKPKVDQLMEEITTAIQGQKELDFREYRRLWEYFDTDFDIKVFNRQYHR